MLKEAYIAYWKAKTITERHKAGKRIDRALKLLSKEEASRQFAEAKNDFFKEGYDEIRSLVS